VNKQRIQELIQTGKDILAHLSKPVDEVHEDYDQADIVYMNSLSAAIAQGTPKFAQKLIIIIAVAFVVMLIWMAFSELDTSVRASGKVIPSSQIQKIQSLEGGVVSEILVREGDAVSINQPLMKISDLSFSGSYEENRIRYLELKARSVRLKAETNATSFGSDDQVAAAMPSLLVSEGRLFDTNQAELNQSVGMLSEQVKQAKSQLMEAAAREKQLARNAALLKREVAITEPLVASNIVSEVDYLQLQTKQSDAEGELESLRLSIPRLKSIIAESESKIKYSQLEFRNIARKELNEIESEVSRLEETQIALADRVARTTLRSPVNGTVKRILSNTIGGVIRAGGDIIEVVPSEDSLLVEIQIKPADIANVEVGHLCRVKFTAYDFAIHGSLKGELKYISADTITEEDGTSYYIARVVPAQSYLGSEDVQLPIKVGMTAEVDIITGKNTILNYLLKPIRRAMSNALTEG
jgi:adhesin transport system membrane fusion protein